MALSHPEVSFQFINNGQTKLHTSGNHNLKDVIYHIYGREVAANLAEIHAVRGDVEITGFIGKPVISRGNRAYENYFINGRYIKSSLISRGIEDAYRTFLMQHKYPFTALHFAMDGQLLDVNVHPTKMELRFSNQEELYEFVRETVRQGLSGRELIPEVKLVREMPKTKAVQEKKAEPAVPLDGPGFSPVPVLESPGQKPEQKQMSQGPQPKPVCASQERSLEYFLAQMQKRVTAEFQENVIRERGSYGEKEPKRVPAPAAKSPKEPKEEARQMELFETGLLNPASKSEIRMIGQLFETYWLVQFEDKFYMIDQHAAHEKVLYERTVKELETKEITSQMVSPPLVLTLTMQEAQRLEEYRDCFRRLGFEIEPFGGRDYAVSAVPGNLFGIAEKDLFLEVLGGLEQAGSRDSGLVLEKIASMSCKAAVKGCQRMSTAEAYALIEELLTLENPYNCPHGRPTIISMTKQEIEKKFKRIV